ncbi:MAG: TIGR04283 family arsenosugar biosynthesis glycosyltransferase [Pseudomonadota bacterium]
MRGEPAAHSRGGQLGVVVIAKNEGGQVGACLASLEEGRRGGLICDVVVSDGGSDDETSSIANDAGARVIEMASGRGGQLAVGAAAARGQWLLFLHADTKLERGWSALARKAIERGEAAAYVFRLEFDERTWAMRLISAGANVRTRLFASPYGDQGLLIARARYDQVGGYRPMPLFEDVDLVERYVSAFGRRALRVLPARAVTSAARYARDGAFRRVFRNAICLAMYKAGRSPERIAAFYEGG